MKRLAALLIAITRRRRLGALLRLAGTRGECREFSAASRDLTFSFHATTRTLLRTYRTRG